MHRILEKYTNCIKIINEDVHNLPFVISIPHSGLFITTEMNNKMKDGVILANMDWYLPQLYDFLESLGFTVVINNVSRYVIDPNRNIESVGSDEYTRSLIYTKTTFGKEIYDCELAQQEIDERIYNFYNEFHKAIRLLITEKQNHFGKIYLIDLHSFGKQIEADVVLGNDDGRTMNNCLFSYIASQFVDNGFSVALNDPFKGGFITKHYGDINNPCESIQIELSYSSYIDKRIFNEEELPYINKEIMGNCKLRLQNIFSNLKKIIS